MCLRASHTCLKDVSWVAQYRTWTACFNRGYFVSISPLASIVISTLRGREIKRLTELTFRASAQSGNHCPGSLRVIRLPAKDVFLLLAALVL